MKILTNPHTYTILLLAGPLTAHQRAVALIRLGPGVAAHTTAPRAPPVPKGLSSVLGLPTSRRASPPKRKVLSPFDSQCTENNRFVPAWSSTVTVSVRLVRSPPLLLPRGRKLDLSCYQLAIFLRDVNRYPVPHLWQVAPTFSSSIPIFRRGEGVD